MAIRAFFSSSRKLKLFCTVICITAAFLLYIIVDDKPLLLQEIETISPNHNKPHEPVQVLPQDYIYQPDWGAAPIVVESHKLIFFWVAKSGCTTFKTLFRRMMGYSDWKTNLNVHYPKTNGLKYLNQYTLQEATAMMSSSEYTRAMIVRDPKERFLSAYLDKAVARNGTFIRLACCHKDKLCWQSHSRPQPQQGNQTYNMSTHQTSLRNFFELTRHCHNPHWNPQGYRLGRDSRGRTFLPTLDFVGHMGNITSAGQALLEKIGAWDEYGKSGWGPHGNESIFASRNGLSASHKTSISNEDSWTNLLPKYYTAELEVAVEERFEVDYATPEFGLQKRKIIFT